MEGKDLKVFFQDEARFGRIDDPRRCWSPAKIRPIVRRQIVRVYTYAYGAVCPFDGTSCFLILPVMNSDCMKIMINEMANRRVFAELCHMKIISQILVDLGNKYPAEK